MGFLNGKMLMKVNFKLVSKFYSRGFRHIIHHGKQWLNIPLFSEGFLA